MQQPVLIVPTGLANVASVRAGIERAGAISAVAESPDEIAGAGAVVLPGVGAFGAAMAVLVERGFAHPLRERVRAGAPTLAICLGLQLLFAASEESPGTGGLGVIDAAVRRFPEGRVVPHMGWNEVTTTSGCRLLESGFAYFANSFCTESVPAGWEAATSSYGGEFVAALERGGVLACQFHPELSGAFGQALLRRWLGAIDVDAGPC